MNFTEGNLMYFERMMREPPCMNRRFSILWRKIAYIACTTTHIVKSAVWISALFLMISLKNQLLTPRG